MFKVLDDYNNAIIDLMLYSYRKEKEYADLSKIKVIKNIVDNVFKTLKGEDTLSLSGQDYPNDFWAQITVNDKIYFSQYHLIVTDQYETRNYPIILTSIIELDRENGVSENIATF